ncbi:MAG: hypothetical protein BSOLF_0396 [Candidatus Carbobacillus altaicus]|uniref:Uncharacterized protein n=1 Tax=Candidatus Carbonibacillus altaicus TaxID=2163959 RepID=A0A2R6Y5F3_9BACL|nr:MAG: hypothetical protein BSOLF_0396 [Candidatus Carbobacillus altaicus]
MQEASQENIYTDSDTKRLSEVSRMPKSSMGFDIDVFEE